MTKRIRKNAPEGATHYYAASGEYIKDMGKYLLKWDESRGKWCACFLSNTDGCIFIGKTDIGSIVASVALIIGFVAVMVVW